MPLQDILLDSAGPDPTHSRCGSSVSAGSLLEGQNLSPSYGSTESPTGKDWGHGFFKYIFFLPQLLSFFWDSDYPYFRPSGFCSLDHPLSRPRPEDLFILFLLFPPSLRMAHFYRSIFKSLPLCIPALNFIWFLFVFSISLLRFPVFSFIKSILKKKT